MADAPPSDYEVFCDNVCAAVQAWRNPRKTVELHTRIYRDLGWVQEDAFDLLDHLQGITRRRLSDAFFETAWREFSAPDWLRRLRGLTPARDMTVYAICVDLYAAAVAAVANPR